MNLETCTHALHCCWYSDDLLYSAAESLDIVGPVQHIPNVDILGDAGVFEPAPQMVTFDSGRGMENCQRYGPLSDGCTLWLARYYESEIFV